jgi:hypothetical protein
MWHLSARLCRRITTQGGQSPRQSAGKSACGLGSSPLRVWSKLGAPPLSVAQRTRYYVTAPLFLLDHPRIDDSSLGSLAALLGGGRGLGGGFPQTKLVSFEASSPPLIELTASTTPLP